MARKEEELLLSVADVTLIDNETKVEYATASLKSHNISQSVDTSEIRAGRKNAVIATLESNKTITVELEDVHANRDWLAIAMDTELNEGTSVKIRVLPQKLKVEENNRITLAKAPKYPAELKVLKSDGTVLTAQADPQDETNHKFLLTDNETVEENKKVKRDDLVQVMSYIYEAPVADVMAIGGEGVGRSFAMYLEESVFNNDMAVIATKTTYFPRVVPESSFTMEGSSELAEQNMTYTFTVTKAEGEDALGYIYYVNEERRADKQK